MCGRFDQDQSNREIDKLLASLPPGSAPVKNGEIFPTNRALTLICKDGEPVPDAMAWGFPGWKGKGVIFNARAESALEKPMFRKALLTKPTAIPTTGFYEWHSPPDGPKQKLRFTASDAPLLWLAGFWQYFPEEPEPERFTILTTQANESVRPWHSRMPVLLREPELEPWLQGENLNEVLKREPFPIKASPA